MKSTGNPLHLAGQGFQQPQPGQGDHRTYQSRTMGHPWLLLRKSISGWWKSTYPLKNDGVHQLRWLFPIYGKIKTCSKPPTRHSTTNHVVSQYFLGGSCTFSLQPIHWWKTMKSKKYCWWKNMHQLIGGLSVFIPLLFSGFQHVSTIQGGAGFLPSTLGRS